jgi:hypothetical protein
LSYTILVSNEPACGFTIHSRQFDEGDARAVAESASETYGHARVIDDEGLCVARFEHGREIAKVRV